MAQSAKAVPSLHGSGVRDYAAPKLSRKALSWRGGSAEAISLVGSEGVAEFCLTSSRHAIYFTDCCLSAGAVQFDGKEMNFIPMPHLNIYPAGGEVRGWARNDKSRYAAFFLEPEFLARSSGLETPRGLSLIPSSVEPDPFAWQLVQAIRAECEAGAPQGILYAETAATMLSIHLLRHHSNLDQQKLKPARGGLAPYQLRRVTDYIGDRLAYELSLEELAGLVGLSPHHLCRAFKQSTGLPPHRWQIAQRVKKAQALMLDTTLSLADIALAAGFSDQSHLTTIFRKAIGTTPNAWRRATKT